MAVRIRQQIKDILRQSIGGDIDISLTIPPKLEMGDFSFALFELAKEQKKNPVELAAQLAVKLMQDVGDKNLIVEVQAVGPYLNIFVDKTAVVAEALKTKVAPKKGRGKIALDVFQANPLKMFHIGHLLNATLGDSLRRIVEFNGYKTATYSYSGDVGVHVAKWLWYYKNFYKGNVPKKEFNRWAGEVYAAACAKAAENSDYEKEINEINRLIDRRDKSIVSLWKKMTRASYKASWQIAKILDCRVDYSFPESICEDPGKKFVQAKMKSGSVKKDQGAWVIDLQQYKLGVFILIKTDGTALYQTKDLGLAQLRQKKIGKYDKCLFVVGGEQEFYFRQLFKTLEILGHPDAGKCEHVSHGLVSLKEGKMSSRLGNVISFDELLDRAQEKILEAINLKNPDLKNKNKVARIVALGALKFSMLHAERTHNVVFDWEQALSFEGNSGPYLQYSYARIRAIERKFKRGKSKIRAGKIDYSLLVNVAELRLIRVVSRFGTAVEKSFESYQPSVISNYLIELASEFNHFYHECKVVDPEHMALSFVRLELLKKVAEVLKQGLYLLGIDVVEEM
ncbi:MAG: arginine--tRNA ligase [Patescibacteria group bacterium]|jgi:arginyl-tRNA synthetase